GADGSGQAFIFPLADYLASAANRTALIVPIAISGTAIEEWVPGIGHHWPRFTTAIADLTQLGLRPDYVLWHQGEANASWDKEQNPGAQPTLQDATRLSYMRNFLSIVSGLRDLGVAAPVFLARATICGASYGAPDVQAAQVALANSVWKIYRGADTDSLD